MEKAVDRMKIAIVYLTLNAESLCSWEETLRMLDAQTFQPDLRLLIDSESSDQTVKTAQTNGFEVLTEKRCEFDHGGTRNRALRYLDEKGFDIVIFSSQDVVFASENSLRELVSYLTCHPITGVFGRQLSRGENTYEDWQKTRCYPETSCVKTQEDIPGRGLMAAFFSNAFSAWRIREALAYGAFSKTSFGEDMLLAATILLDGGAVGYCAEATCRHDHSNSLKALFRRGIGIGELHRNNPFLQKKFGTLNRCCRTLPPVRFIPELTAKTLGYFWGKYFDPFRFPMMIFILMWLLLLPGIIFSDIPARDLATRYAPMAEAFAQWDPVHFLHPRIPPAFPVIAGIIAALTGVSGFLACKLASALMLTASIFPIWAGVRRLGGEHFAKIAVVLFCACSYLLRIGYSGLRESTSLFAMNLLFSGFCTLSREPRKRRLLFLFPAGLTLLLLNRGDHIILAVVIAVILLVLDIRYCRIPCRSLYIFLLTGLLTAPYLLYNYHMIGYPVTDVRHAAVLRLLKEKGLPIPENKNPVMELQLTVPGRNNDH